jgi:hypothetical protein
VAVRDGTERRQAAIVASSSDAIVGRDLDCVVTSWNAAAERMYGYSAAEAIGHHMQRLLVPGHGDELVDLTARIRAGEVVEHYETRRARSDGTVIDVSVAMSPIRDARGNLVGTSTTARDITEAKAAAKALAALEARKSAILESALDCVITMDRFGQIVEFNPAAERTFGYSREEAVGRLLADLVVPPAQRRAHAQGLERHLRTGEGRIVGHRQEMVAQRADGTELPVELAVTRVDLPEGPVFTGYLRDLTEQKLARSRLVESQQLLEGILENSPALISLNDRQGRYLFINRQLAEALGVDAEAAKGRTAEELAPPEVSASWRDADRQVWQTGQPYQYEGVMPSPDGDRTLLMMKFPVLDAAGAMYAIATISTDITERKAAEAERELLGQRLRQSERLESLGQLAGGVAHDFNNLLAVILNYAAFVAEDTLDNPSLRADVEQIRIAAERAARLTKQLLTVGRREAVQTELLDVNGLVEETRSLLSRTLGEHIELVVQGDQGLPAISADRGQIEQVLLNLAVNARDAMPAGGTLTISTGVTDLDEDYARLHPGSRPGRHVALSVSDTGSGMAPEVLPHIFEPFFTTKPQGEGTGLGLATVYGVVTRAGGSIAVYSEPGLGTTFRVFVPVAQDQATVVAAPRAEHLEGRGETVLVVDDEPALAATTARMLRRHGYVVLEASSGAAALELAGGQEIHLLITDSVMPKMSGRELVSQVTQLWPELPVIFMSGYSEGVIGPQRIIAEGATLIEKPFSSEVLLAKVRQAIDGAARPPGGRR